MHVGIYVGNIHRYVWKMQLYVYISVSIYISMPVWRNVLLCMHACIMYLCVCIYVGTHAVSM